MDTLCSYPQDLTFTPQLPYAFYSCTFTNEHYTDSQFTTHKIDFPAKLNNAVAKRKAEFLAGRICAKHALQHIDIDDVQILSGEDRAPIWPQGVKGSITHTQGIAIAMCSRDTELKGLGIDVERFMGDEQEQKLQTQILHPEENSTFSSLSLTIANPLTLIFSAKESIYKALYPSVGKFFGFDAVKLINFTNSELNFVIVEQLSTQLPVGKQITVRYQLSKNLVFTECEYK
ncbi:phosphopantetheinyl transferase [Pseudoalteromonas citrea]|uniref:Enterobactin synthase component D n=1 Tax=Pseudoalteromonas citrea TaxID=43655 RepID=A0A5S3XSS2_9GAMM|nr:4'-phosphopantetheinyl transferase superfamily protein [Pseudoalteromonas citrea]TMP45287.1 phosphopantetheinyl transferase [Pseudoalteromonas citrea]TMP61247.1 phosphopantetheinyl transferase [Pseudoalteromonas citrea]